MHRPARRPPPSGFATMTEATPLVFASMVVSRATKPGRRKGLNAPVGADIVDEALALPFALRPQLRRWAASSHGRSR